MATVREMKATARPRAGKGAARTERRAGRVPGVIYGDNKPPMTISVEHEELPGHIYGDNQPPMPPSVKHQRLRPRPHLADKLPPSYAQHLDGNSQRVKREH